MEPLAFCCAESDIFPHLSSDQLTLVICYIYIFIYGILLPSRMGILISHYKDPYKPISKIGMS